MIKRDDGKFIIMSRALESRGQKGEFESFLKKYLSLL